MPSPSCARGTRCRRRSRPGRTGRPARAAAARSGSCARSRPSVPRRARRACELPGSPREVEDLRGTQLKSRGQLVRGDSGIKPRVPLAARRDGPGSSAFKSARAVPFALGREGGILRRRGRRSGSGPRREPSSPGTRPARTRPPSSPAHWGRTRASPAARRTQAGRPTGSRVRMLPRPPCSETQGAQTPCSA